MSALSYTPPTRDDMKPGAVFVVMVNGDTTNNCFNEFQSGDRVMFDFDDGSDEPSFRRVIDGKQQFVTYADLSFDGPEPLTSHAVAAAEIARLRGQVAALRDALQEIVQHCNNQGYGNPIVDNRTVDRCEETAMAALAAQEQAP